MTGEAGNHLLNDIENKEGDCLKNCKTCDIENELLAMRASTNYHPGMVLFSDEWIEI